MPRITGPNIAEHVATQESAIFSTATKLFAKHGVNAVSMGAIAQAVDLARPSLYRYFPTKASIVLRWFDITMTPLIEHGIEVSQSGEPAAVRLHAWIGLQLDFLENPDNQAMIRASVETSDLSADQIATISTRHKDLYQSLAVILTDLGTPAKLVRPRSLIIAGLVRSILDLTSAGVPTDIARPELIKAATLVAGTTQQPHD